MIPDVYLVEYQTARGIAHELAQLGELVAGYTELLEHWEAAMALQREGVDWAFPLTILYLTAMDDYCEAHGPSEPPREQRRETVNRKPVRRESSSREPTAARRPATKPSRGAYWAAWLRTRRGRMA
ncbi:MAG: hypothetical protein K0Q72_1723 [Armatimonadetes bacterium]|jgi:hypothetical protein|nr:hypothetical protein [Armatimonadota bacterium]